MCDIYQAVWLKPREAAKYARVSERILREWLHTGEIPFYKPSTRVTLIKRNDLDEWIENKKATSSGTVNFFV